MKSNLHSIDRTVRLLFAAVVAVLFFLHVITGKIAIILIAVAAILALTAFINFCPLYHILGISTKKKSA